MPAVAAAMGFLFLAVGSYLQVGEYGWYFAASVAMMLPVSRGYYRGGVLAVCVSSLLVLGVNGFNIAYLIPFCTFMGFHPILNGWQREKNIRGVWIFILKEIWFLASVFITYKFTALLLFDIGKLEVLVAPLILLIAALAFVPYDWAMLQIQKKIDRLTARSKIN